MSDVESLITRKTVDTRPTWSLRAEDGGFIGQVSVGPMPNPRHVSVDLLPGRDYTPSEARAICGAISEAAWEVDPT